MKSKIALTILAGVLAFIVADNWPTPRAAPADAFICDDLGRAMVDFCRGILEQPKLCCNFKGWVRFGI